MKAVHFGAGNIGRGFIGEVLAHNNIEIVFVDMNETIIDNLNARGEYDIAYASPEAKQIHITNVRGINNGSHPEKVAQEIAKADIVTTAIGPNILKFIAPLIAQALQVRLQDNNQKPLDIIACENMIGGSQALKELVYQDLSQEQINHLDDFVGFPNAAVDRIIPIQSNEDPLFVSVEPFSEWVIDQSQMKHTDLILEGVEYVENLEPFIERKLLSVNTGHATVAYAGKQKGYETVREAIADKEILDQLIGVLNETGSLLIDKWGFELETHNQYKNKIVERFQNPYISDDLDRVARTPIRKLSYNERFILPIRELADRNLAYTHLLDTVGMAFHFDNPSDDQSVELQEMLKNESLEDVIKKITELESDQLINEIKESILKYSK